MDNKQRVVELVEWVARRLFKWHCKSLHILQESLVKQNDIVKGYWIDKAKELLTNQEYPLYLKIKKGVRTYKDHNGKERSYGVNFTYVPISKYLEAKND